ncbi:MAG: hypothetical protein COB39_13740 [Marinosulfonomonas sp.]|nr:MAG: hypothetical protein COB39_13740 [Marinosulfonomonas sp.]
MAKVVCSVYEWQNTILNNLHPTDFLTTHLKEKTMKTAISPKAIVAGFSLAMLMAPAPAAADEILGTWVSPPMAKSKPVMVD